MGPEPDNICPSAPFVRRAAMVWQLTQYLEEPVENIEYNVKTIKSTRSFSELDLD